MNEVSKAHCIVKSSGQEGTGELWLGSLIYLKSITGNKVSST